MFMTKNTNITTMSSITITLKILNNNSLHFLTLSLFFIPLAFFLTNLQNSNTLITGVALTTLISVITGVALTTYSTHQALLRNPLTFTSTFKSLSHSFIPLLTTFAAATLELTLLAIWLPSFGRSCFLSFLVLVHSVIWGFAPPIAVLENKYGFEPLLESRVLAVNYWKMLLVNVLYSGGLIGTLLCHLILLNTEKSAWSWISLVQVGVKYAQFLMVLVFYVVMVTMLYVRAKAARVVGDVFFMNLMEINFEDLRVRVVHGDFIYLMLSFNLLFPIISKYA